MSKSSRGSVYTQSADDMGKQAKEFAERGDYRNAVFMLMVAVGMLADELDDVTASLVKANIVDAGTYAGPDSSRRG